MSECLRVLGPETVPDTIVAGEIGRRFGRRDYVINRDAVFCVRKFDIDDLCSQFAVPFNYRFNILADLFVQTFAK